MFPDNLIKACFTQVKTVYVSVNENDVSNMTEDVFTDSSTQSEPELTKVLQDSDGMNVLGKS